MSISFSQNISQHDSPVIALYLFLFEEQKFNNSYTPYNSEKLDAKPHLGLL